MRPGAIRSGFGYKDFIPMFKVDKFNPDLIWFDFDAARIG